MSSSVGAQGVRITNQKNRTQGLDTIFNIYFLKSVKIILNKNNVLAIL